MSGSGNWSAFYNLFGLNLNSENITVVNETCLHKVPMINSIIREQKAQRLKENKAGRGKNRNHITLFSAVPDWEKCNSSRCRTYDPGCSAPKRFFLSFWKENSSEERCFVVQPGVLHADFTLEDGLRDLPHIVSAGIHHITDHRGNGITLNPLHP